MPSFIRTTFATVSLCVLFVPCAHGIPAAPDSCGLVTWEGQCEGTELTWCEDGQVLVADCAELGGTCGWSDDIGAYDCVNADSGCGGETYEGRCDGNTVVWCEEGVVYEADCGDIADLPGATCGYSCEASAYDCSASLDQVTSEEMCGEPGTGSFPADLDDSDTTGDGVETESEPAASSGGCAGGGSGSGAVWLLLGLLGLVAARSRRQVS